MRPTTARSLFTVAQMAVTEHELPDGSRLTLWRRYERGSLPLYRVCHEDLLIWEGPGKAGGHRRFLDAVRALT